jgi:hypothetical protein
MVVECVNCEYYCHEGDANLPFDEELRDIKISLRLENKLHHMLCPDILYYGSRMVQVSPLDHDGSGDKWLLFYCYGHFQSDGSYTDERVLQHCRPLIEYHLNVNWNDNCFKPILAMELKTSGKTLLLSHQKKRKSKQQGLTNKHHEKMAMQEEHIMNIALNGENYCLAIHRRQLYFVAGASVRMRGARMFTPQMIAGLMQKEGTYHFFEMKGTALSLMVPNVGSKWKRKKDAVNTFKVLKTSRLVTFTTEIFGIPLMKHSRYALKHCLVDVKGDKRACYATKEAAVFAACIRGILEYPYKHSKTRNGVPTWVDHILPLHRQNDPLKNYCCLFTHRYKTIHLEKSVIDPSFIGIVSFRGNDHIMSVSKGGEPFFEEFNLSSLYQISQE